MRPEHVIAALIALVVGASSRGATTLSPTFTYQGQLKQGGAPIDGTGDFVFTLWDAAGGGNPPVGGTQVGGPQAINALPVTGGLFSVVLNAGGEFGGGAFNGSARWLQIAVRSPAGVGAFTTLAPRQSLTAAPHAVVALNTVGVDGHSLDAADGNPTDALFIDNAGNVGIGTSTPAQRLTIQTPTNSYGLLHTDGVRSMATYIGGGGNGGYVGTTSNHSLHLYADDSDPLLTVHPNRNIGIGTLTPAVKLDVNGSLNANSGATITGTNGDGAVVTARRATGDPYVVIDATTAAQNSVLAYRKNNFNRWLMYTDSSAESGGNAGSNFKLDAYNNSGGIANYLFVERATGNVGIGTTDPAAKLHVVGGTDITPGGGGFIVTGNTAGANIAISDVEIQARFNGAPFGLVINNDGGDVVFGGAIDIGYEVVVATEAISFVSCPAGKKVLGGGCRIEGDAEIRKSYPLNNGWKCELGDISGFPHITAYAICARVK